MLEKGNSSNDGVTEVDVEQSTHSIVGVGSSSQAAVKVYSTTADAIANFKPTHREVISGIAPHVFDERKKKRSRSRRRVSPPTRPYWCNEPSGEKRSSPLRGTIVYAWEAERSIYLDDPQLHSKENIETNSIRAFTTSGPSIVQLQEKAHNKINSDNLKIEGLWRYLRFDANLFKLRSIAVKLKYTRTL